MHTVGSRALAALALVLSLLVVPAHAAHADAAGLGGDYVTLAAQARVLDTRNGTGGLTGARGPGSTSTFPVLGVGGVPASGVRAVLVDVTPVGPSSATYLTLWADGAARPATSMIQASAGETLSASAVVPVGANGRIALYNNAGSTHVVVDVQGWFTATTTGGGTGGFVPVTQARLVDTRAGLGAPAGAVAPGGAVTVTIGGVPDGAPSAMLDVVVPSAGTGGYWDAAPAGTTAWSSVLQFGAGTTSSASAVRLAADRRVTFVNRSTAPAHLVLTVTGYFAAASSQGAGLRPVTARLIDTRTTGVPVLAGETVDIPVAGTNGLPTNAIAGAVVNLTVVGQSVAGHLRAWPAGQPEPTGTSIVNFPAAGARSGLAVVPAGPDGAIRVRNVSGAQIHLVADLQGWFAEPIPRVPVAQSTAMTIRHVKDGTSVWGSLAYAYVDDEGQLVTLHQPDASFFSNTYETVLSGPGEFTGPPALAQIAGSRVQVAAQRLDREVWTRAQTSASTPTQWTAWSDLGGSMAAPPVSATFEDGTPAWLAVDGNGRIWLHIPDGTTRHWRSLGDWNMLHGIAVIPISNNRLRIFGIDGVGDVKTAVITRDGFLWRWSSVGPSEFTGPPVVVAYPGDRARVIGRTADGALLTKLSDADGSFSGDWQPLGGIVAAGQPSAVLEPQSGRTEIVVRGTDNEIYRNEETGAATNTWSGWSKVFDGVDPTGNDPTAVALPTFNANLSWFVAFRDPNGNLRIYAFAPPSSASASSVGRAVTP